MVKNKGKKVIVLGGGPAGLSAAWMLSRNGIDVELVELESKVGGLCRTIKHGDFYFDLGGHRFLTQDKDVFNEIKALMKDDIVVRPRKSVIRLKGKYFGYPLNVKDLLKKLNPLLTSKCFLDYLFTIIINKINPKEDVSLQDWISHRFGKTLYNIYFGPYSEKLWGIPPTQISADWAAQRISLLNLWDVFVRLLGKKEDTPKTYAEEYLYPKQGIGMIADRQAEEITKNGGKIHIDSKVQEITIENNKIKEVVFNYNGTRKAISADYIINTIPLPEFVRMMKPLPEQNIIDTSRRMRFRGLRFLNIELDKEQVSENNWIYIPEHQYFFFRIQEPKNWSPYNVPEGKTSLILEIATDKGDDIWDKPDDVILQRCVKDLKDLGFDIENKVMDCFSTYAPHAYPIYDLDYKEKIKTLLDYLDRFENLLSCGRQGLYRYNNMDHSIKMGLKAAEHVISGSPKKEILDIANEQEGFESKVKLK
ncbi:FAD-dependent oxidoreductase [bacterium]|nr:FAD-dependent oxidoreductase [bacterium]